MSSIKRIFRPEFVTVLVDSREKLPLDLSPMKIVTATLPTGDYSLAGMQNEIAIERKSLADLVMSFSSERERFEKELQRMRGYKLKQVVVECHEIEIEQHKYRSNMNPHALLQSCRAWGARDIPFIFAGDRQRATNHIRETLLFYVKDKLSGAFPIFDSILESQNVVGQ